MAYIDAHRGEFRAEPICGVLTRAGTQITPSTYYAAKTRAPSVRLIRDVAMTETITIHEQNYGVYGVDKAHATAQASAGAALSSFH